MTGKIDKKWTAILVAFPAALSVLDPHLQFSILPDD
jgi:hypothetical protein